MGKFVIKTSEKGCHFVLKADNGEVIATSQHYKSKDSCKKGHREREEERPHGRDRGGGGVGSPVRSIHERRPLESSGLLAEWRRWGWRGAPSP